MSDKYNRRKRLTIILSWLMVLFWMGIIFWFSSQPANESVRWSVGFMEVGRELIRYWEWIGIISFVVIYHIFLIWLAQAKTNRFVKLLLFIVFIIISLGMVYVLLNSILPRIELFGLFQMNRWVIHRYLRKYAHFLIYLLLGGVIKHALTVSSVKGLKAIGIAVLISFLYAISDELHQYFVPGRMPLVLDVVIDTGGAIVGILLYTTINYGFNWLKRKINRYSKKTG